MPWRDDKDQVTGLRFPEKSVLLTFDDGPSARYTPVILDILARFGVRGVFFEVGRNVGKAAAETRRVLASGQALANHSFTHAFLPKLDADGLNHQLADTNQALAAAANEKTVLFRPPYGARNEQVLKTASDAGNEDRALERRFAGLGRSGAAIDRQSRGQSGRAAEARDHPLSRHSRAHHRGAAAGDRRAAKARLHVPGLGWPRLRRAARRSGARRRRRLPRPAGRERRAPAAPLAGVRLYRDSWAVVVGINAYKNWPRLSYAVNDAQAVRDMLVHTYAFPPDHVTTLLDGEATREKILAALGDNLADAKKVAHDDRVFVFFAGHGVTRKLPSGKSQGYIVPVDAAAQSFQSQAISMTNLQDASDAIPAKHVFFVMDACYSGLALTRGGSAGGAAPIGAST